MTSLRIEEARTWTDEQLVLEYERRVELSQQLVGWLYSGIISYDLSVIDEVARSRDDFHITQWRDLGIVPSTWTDEHGVVHAWRRPSECGYNYNRKPDPSAKPVTCLQCVVRP